MQEKLSKFTRLFVYSYLQTDELITKVSKLNQRERANLSGAQIACTNREGVLVLPKDCFLHQRTFHGLEKELAHIFSLMTYLTIKIDFT